jgi:ketol-acid reductoisomerase
LIQKDDMAARIYYDADADLQHLADKTIAILGYGSQGHAHAQNLRDSGCRVVVGQRPGSANYKLAQCHGFQPMSLEDATAAADIVNLLLPDEVQGELYQTAIKPQLRSNAILMCSHGFNFHFGYVQPPAGTETLLVAPKGPGHLVRSEYVRGAGVPCLIAMASTGAPRTLQLGLAYAKGIGGTRAGVIQTTFAEEVETDLFGEQVVLCGGLSQLIKSGFQTLVDAGYQPEMAYFECLHETKLIVDLLYQGGLSYMRHSISNTAEYGDYTRGPRIITDQTRAEMKNILAEIRSGQFAQEWIEEHRQGGVHFQQRRSEECELLIEQIGRKLRRMMPFIEDKQV